MKRLLQSNIMPWLLGILFAAMFQTACQKVDAEMDAVAEKADPDIEFISSLGYDVSDIEKADDGYLVEGDIWLTDQWIADAKKQSQTRLTQQPGVSFVSIEYQNKLYLDIDRIATPSISWAGTMALACRQWNGLGSNINIAEGPGNGREQIIITFADKSNFDPANKLMKITPPTTNGRPGRVTINQDCSFLPKDYFAHPDQENMGYLIMHAIGHALGLGHTLSDDQISQSDNDRGDGIKNTSRVDNKSIMRRETVPLPWSGFSADDRAYIPNVVFPKSPTPPTPALTAGKIEATKTIAHGTTTLAINSTEAATGGSGTITYSWEKKSGTTWIVISGQTGVNLNTAIPTETTSEYRRKATDGKTTATSNSCVVTTQQFNPGSIATTLTIDTENPGDQITVNSTGSAVCQNGATYAWEINTGTSWAVIPGAAGTSLTTVAPMQFATRYRRKATCAHTNKYTTECTVLNEAFLSPGELAPLVEINKTSFCASSFHIPYENASVYLGLKYNWEVNTGSGWTNYYGDFNRYGNDDTIWQHITKFRRSVSTPQGKKKYTNECTLINYAFREDPKAGCDFANAIKLGPYWNSFSETLTVDTRGSYFKDLDQATGGSKDAFISLELRAPTSVDIITGGAWTYVWLSVWGEGNTMYCHYETSYWPRYSNNIFPVFEGASEGVESDIFTFRLDPGKYSIQLQGVRVLNGSDNLNNIIGISIRGTSEP